MIYCTKCGKQNPDSAKFCTGCGTGLSNKIQATPVAEKGTDQPRETKSNKTTVWLLFSLLVVIIIISAYFIFFNKKKESPVVEKENNSANELVVQPNKNTPENNNTNSNSEPVPLNPGNQSSNVTISQAEVDNVSSELRTFYQCENEEDIDCLLRQYSFPVNRYYQIYNVTYEALHKLFTESFNEKLNYHHITIKWDYCTIQKINDGYKAVLYADYEFVRSTAPGENRSRSIQIIINLNSSFRITSIYEN